MARTPWAAAAAIALALSTAVALTAPSPLAAHGPRPQAQRILFHPSDPDVIVVQATFGWLVTTDGGATWEWVCTEAVEGRLGTAVRTVLTGDDALLAATNAGLYRATDIGCAWSHPDDALTSFVRDVVHDPAGARALLALPSSTTDPNRLFRSDDDGRTWAPSGTELPEGFLPERLLVAPSAPGRLYVGGFFPVTRTTPRRAAVYRSNDGGSTWVERPFELREGEILLYLVGVDPSDPDRLWAHASGETHERLTLSTDGGDSWTDVRTLEVDTTFDRPFAFALSPDGTAWFGNPEAGLLRTDGSTTTVVDEHLVLTCLAMRDTELWVCGDGFVDGFAVARVSGHEPVAYDPVLRFEDVTAIRSCGGTSVDSVCPDWWDDLQLDLMSPPDAGPLFDGGLSEGDGGMDGSSGGGGCACSAAARPGDALASALLILPIASGLARRTRRRRRALRSRAGSRGAGPRPRG